MDRRQAGRVAELGLRDRQLVSLPVHQADGPEAHIDFAQDVRDPGVSIAPADIDDPLPKHRRIDERLAPDAAPYGWLGLPSRTMMETSAGSASCVKQTVQPGRLRLLRRHEPALDLGKEEGRAGEAFRHAFDPPYGPVLAGAKGSPARLRPQPPLKRPNRSQPGGMGSPKMRASIMRPTSEE